MNRSTRGEEGFAVLIAITAMLLALALGAGLVLTTSAESLITRHFQAASEALYAAEAGIEYAAVELAAAPLWNDVLAGARRSAFADGTPTGSRTLADGSAVDLDATVAMANCGRTSPCSPAEMDLVTSDRPWGRNNPRWQLYAWGPLANLPSGASSPYYVMVMVGDDPAENDNDPLVDGGPPAGGAPTNPGQHIVALRSETFGPGGIRRTVEVTVTRSTARLSWREVP